MRKHRPHLAGLRQALLLLTTAGVILTTVPWGFSYETYSGCRGCHGSFTGSTSPKGTVFPSGNKHEMHRGGSYMDTDCSLCHVASSRTPVYINRSAGTANNQGIGCTGCHVAAGLRLHHINSGVTVCGGCHQGDVSQPENVKPPYYGTIDTRARNPGNDVQAANTNENWSIGDFEGLDNDGNNLYDQADYAIGPFRLLSAIREGNDVRVSWLTAGGRTNRVQAASDVTGTYAPIGTQTRIPGVGLVITNYLDVGAATNPTRFYRLSGR